MELLTSEISRQVHHPNPRSTRRREDSPATITNPRHHPSPPRLLPLRQRPRGTPRRHPHARGQGRQLQLVRAGTLIPPSFSMAPDRTNTPPPSRTPTSASTPPTPKSGSTAPPTPSSTSTDAGTTAQPTARRAASWCLTKSMVRPSACLIVSPRRGGRLCWRRITRTWRCGR